LLVFVLTQTGGSVGNWTINLSFLRPEFSTPAVIRAVIPAVIPVVIPVVIPAVVIPT
jgi:hypothetical protein